MHMLNLNTDRSSDNPERGVNLCGFLSHGENLARWADWVAGLALLTLALEDSLFVCVIDIVLTSKDRRLPETFA